MIFMQTNISQQKVWEAISEPWKNFRVHPLEEVSNFLNDKKGKILDLCCGSGRNFITTNEQTIYGVDFSENMLKYAKEHANKINAKTILKRADAEKLPFKDDFLDSAIFISSLHCIETKEKRQKTLKELYRVLKSNSQAMITVWDKNQEAFKEMPKETFIPWKKTDKTYQRYYYLYDKEELEEELKKAGFKIIKILDKNNLEGFYSKRNLIAIVEK